MRKEIIKKFQLIFTRSNNYLAFQKAKCCEVMLNKRFLEKYAGILIAGFLFISIFSPVFFKGGLFSGGDLVNQYIPYKYFMKDSIIKEREIPLWNTLHFSGRPFLADIQTGVFYPPNWLVTFFSPEVFFTIATLLHIILGIIGMRKYAGIVTRNKTLRILAGILFGLSAFNTTRLAEFSGVVLFIFTAAWLPWIFFYEEMLYKTRKVKHSIWLSICIAMQLFAGSPQIAFYTWIALFVIFIFQILTIMQHGKIGNTKSSQPVIIKGKFSINARGFSAGVILAFLLGTGLFAVQFFPTKDFIGNSFERGRGGTIEYIASDSIKPAHLATYLIPFYFSDPNSSDVYNLLKTGYHEFNLYSGAAIIYLFLLAIFLSTREQRVFEINAFGKSRARDRKRLYYTWMILAVFGIFSSFGDKSFLFKFLYQYIPGFDSFRVPARMMMFWWVASIIIGIMTLDLLTKLISIEPNQKKNEPYKHLPIKAAIYANISFAIFFIIAAVMFFGAERLYDTLGLTEEIKFQESALNSSALSQILALARSSALRTIGFLTITWITIVLIMAKKIKPHIFSITMLLIFSTDLFLFSKGFIYTKPIGEFKESFYHQTTLVKFLKANLKEGERYTWLDDVFDFRNDQNQLELYSNRPMVFALNDMRGYDPNFSALYGQFINIACSKDPLYPQGAFMSFTSPDGTYKINYSLLSLFNVKYILSYDSLTDKQLRLAKQITFGMSPAQTLNIYENIAPSGRIFFRQNALKNHKTDKLSISNPIFNPGKEAIPNIDYIDVKEFSKDLTLSEDTANLPLEFSSQIILDKSGKGIFKVKTNKSGMLIFSEVFDEGWKIYINGSKANYIPVNVALGGIFIQPGEWTIEKKYLPLSLIRGGIISLASLLILILLSVSQLKKNIKVNKD